MVSPPGRAVGFVEGDENLCSYRDSNLGCVPSLLILWQGMDAICRHSKSVYASCCVFIVFKKIESPAACEMRSVIRFLNAKNMKPAEIHRQICDVHGEHAMSSSVLRRCVRLFNPFALEKDI